MKRTAIETSCRGARQAGRFDGKRGGVGVMARSIPNLPDRETLLGLFEEHGAAAALRDRGADRLPQGRDARASCISTSARRRPAVGVCAHLRPTDWVTSTHRGHGHALAKGADPRPGDGGAVRQGRRHAAAAAAAPCISTTARSACSAPTASSRAGIGHAVGIGIGARRAGARRHRRRLLRRRRGQPWRLPRGARISPPCSARRRSSSARTTSTPPRRRSARSRSTRRSPPRPPPTACPAWPSTATTCSRSGRRCARRSSAPAAATGRR